MGSGYPVLFVASISRLSSSDGDRYRARRVIAAPTPLFPVIASKVTTLLRASPSGTPLFP